VIDKALLLLKALPGLFVAAVAVLHPLAGTGLGHEGWEATTQKAAAYIGALLVIAIALLYGNRSTPEKRRLAAISFGLVVVCLVLDGAAWLLETYFATTMTETSFARDVVFRSTYFLFCLSILGFIGCVGLFIPTGEIVKRNQHVRRTLPAPALCRCDDLNPPVRHVTIPMNSHMTDILS
jgi:hypothetical protein